jgi:NitT/TauT family transport system substrate-binding protein
MHPISATVRLLFVPSVLVLCITAALAEDRLKLAVGARGNWETAAAELGQNAGFFRKRGLVLDLLYTQGSGETQQAVISGSVAIGVGLGTTSVMNAFAKGAPLRAIGNASTGSSEYWYVPANSRCRASGTPPARPLQLAMDVCGFRRAQGLYGIRPRAGADCA